MADIVAREYDVSFYDLSNISTSAGSGATVIPTRTGLGSPTNLIVTSADTVDELLNGVELFWDNDSSVNSAYCSTEVYGGLSSVLFITGTSIASNVITTSGPHGLVAGMPIYPQIDGNGLLSSEIYYVLTVPSSTTFTVTSTKNSSVTTTLTNGSSLSLTIRTATLLATVPVPSRSYLDTVANEGTGRVEKYYWVRHKVNEI
jgi:hypothetical protein